MKLKTKFKPIKICPVSGKISFESEAKASRRVRNYEQINRYYYCEHCDGYHLTKKEPYDHQVID